MERDTIVRIISLKFLCSSIPLPVSFYTAFRRGLYKTLFRPASLAASSKASSVSPELKSCVIRLSNRNGKLG